MTQPTLSLPGYTAALNKAAFYLISNPGHLRFSGPDRVDFLQRQTTNDIEGLAPGSALVTALTSPTARLLDVLTLVPDEDAISAITSPGRSAQTAAYLQNRIFFMDNVKVDDTSDEFSQIDLLGPAAAEVLAELGFGTAPAENETRSGELAGVSVQILHTYGLGLRLLVPTGETDALIRVLEEAGTAVLPAESYEVLRVEAGLPAAGHELTEEYTPLEVGLTTAVSMTKGCYTGQEVIARQVNYNKVTKQMAGLRLEGSVEPGTRLHSLEGGKAAGSITSAATSPRFGPIALGVLKRPYNLAGVEVVVGDKQAGVRGVVVPLPFEG